MSKWLLLFPRSPNEKECAKPLKLYFIYYCKSYHDKLLIIIGGDWSPAFYFLQKKYMTINLLLASILTHQH